MRRVVLTTGGTGGHIFPALAVAEEIQERFPDVELLFIGGEYGPERDIVARASIPFVALPVRGVLGRGLRSLGALARMIASTMRAMRVIGSFKPDVVIGFGGYAAFAACLGGKLREIPVAIHEQNSMPGVTNKIAARWANRIFVSFPDAGEIFDRTRTVFTGNPVRKDIMALRTASASKKPAAPAEPAGEDNAKPDAATVQQERLPRLLVLGGSLGARVLNDTLMEMLPMLQKANIIVHHQTGKHDEERVQAAYRATGMEHCIVHAFIDDMASAYAEADLVLCRAGATTVAELTVAGKPAVFVPFAQATHNHQVYNAQQLVESGAALMVEEKDLAPDTCAAMVRTLLDDAGRLADMAKASRGCGRPEAAAAVVSGLMDIVFKQPLSGDKE